MMRKWHQVARERTFYECEDDNSIGVFWAAQGRGMVAPGEWEMGKALLGRGLFLSCAYLPSC